MPIDDSAAPSNQEMVTPTDRISALLADDPAFAGDEPKQEVKQEVKEEPEAEEQPEEESDVEEVEAKEDGEPDEEPETLEIDPDEALFDVEETLSDGNKEVKKYSLNELKKQRMLQSDYTRKTQELARQRAEVQVELQKGIDAQRKEYVEALEAQQQAFMELIAPEVRNLDELAETDPAEFVKVQNRLGKYQTAIQQIEQKKAEAIQQQQEYVRTNILPKESELLKTKIPDWNDSMKQAVIETGKKFGITDQELGSLVDHRQVHILHELHRLTQLEQSLKDKKSVAAKKVVEKPKPVKSGGKQKQKSRGEESRSRLRQTGRWQDAVGVIAASLTDIE